MTIRLYYYRSVPIDIGKVTVQTRQISILKSLVKAWSEVEDVSQKAENSNGTAEKNQEVYAESIKGRLAEVEAKGQGIWNSLLNSDEIKVGVSVIDDLVSVLGNLGSVLGKLPTGATIGGISGLIMSLTGHGEHSSVLNVLRPFL